MGRHKIIAVLQPVGFIAAVFCGVQGLVWACVYLAALLTHYCVLTTDDVTPLKFSDYLAAYLQGSSCTGNDIFKDIDLVGPGQLAVWLVIATLLNLLLLTVSIILCTVLIVRTKDAYHVFINTWVGVSIATIVCDIIISVIFALDLNTLERLTCLQDRGIAGLVLTSLLTFSSRAVLILVANVSLTLYFIIASYRLCKGNKKIKELDLTSNWPSTSDSSYDFGTQGDRDNLVGVVNPLTDQGQKSSYPEYSAKSRWPTLNRNFNTVPNKRSYPETNENNKQLKLVNDNDYRSSNGYVNRVNSIYDSSMTKNNSYSNNSYIDDDVFTVEVAPPPRETNRFMNRPLVLNDRFQEKSNVNYNHNKNIIEARNYYNHGNPIKYESKTMPSQRSIPVPPPLPPRGEIYQSNQPRQLIKSEPDYSYHSAQPSPPKQPKPNYTDEQAKLRMTLHEQIRSRPPLRPVLQRMKIGSTGF